MRTGHFDEACGCNVTTAVIATSGSRGFTVAPEPDATRPALMGSWRGKISVANGNNSTSSNTTHQMTYRVAAFTRSVDRNTAHITAAMTAACHKLFRTSVNVFMIFPPSGVCG